MMNTVKKEQQTASSKPEHTNENLKQNDLYKATWRWHFYAGIIFAPFIIFLAITGGIYLFKPQIESFMYQDLYYIQEGQQKVDPTVQVNEVKNAYPNAEITSYTPSPAANRTTEVGISNNGEAITIFVNPYSSDVVGTLKDDETLMSTIKDMHNGIFWGGTLGNRWVELTACWGMILIITGIYLWWPRKNKSLFGILFPRFSKGKRVFWREIHAVTAFWFSLFIAIVLLSGLMWTDVWGNMAKSVVDETGTGSPEGDQPWEKYAFPESAVPTKDVADVPWAAENLPVPESGASGITPISIEKIMQVAESKNVHPGYKIAFPEDKTGVYTVYLDPASKPWTQQTLHIDQYDGQVLAHLGWKDYGIMGKIISLGIAFHQGEFGFINQMFNLLLVLALIIIPLSGLIMWKKRKPNGKLGAPKLPSDFKLLKGLH
ncbi:PepSY-associated TM helix domain-containing protein [Alteribacillus bidgolensis]|uniref:Uncharacterized iron-regulated membrane protein n=1 Tax=Alteribacillus bidgolensis TaxID=930129 RepID=A0A1G8PZN6_9BACI|nr:PepSY domain-containing protein [Alteribacillus bidgolensis]SDI97883.1 Uncharacterized iron-regulated membrane protein [Alteribacillus bidgolensis]